MTDVRYIIEAGEGKYYPSGTTFHTFTKNILKAKAFKTEKEAQECAETIKRYWKKNSRLYCGLTGNPEPCARVRKMTLTITIE